MAWINSGTVALTSGNAGVVGTGTTWVDDGVAPGYAFIGPNGLIYEVLSVTDDTHLTLRTNYGGSTASGQAYRIIQMIAASSQDIYAKVVALLEMLRTDIIVPTMKIGTPTVSDAVLATRGPKVSFEAAGALLAQLSKGSASDALHLTLMSALSGRARFELEASTNDLLLEISSDGSAWTECMRVDNGTGVITLSVDMYDRLGVVINGGGGGGSGGGSILFKGAYNPATTYAANDSVSYQGTSYVSRVDDNLNKTPNLQPSFWQVLASIGNSGTDGNDGWSPVHALVEDGARVVQEVVDWIGGEGTKPATGFYVSDIGFTPDIEDATNVRGATGATGQKGWTAELAVVTDGVRRVHQVVDWFGGEGTKPATGEYVGPSGHTAVLAEAVDIRGGDGPAGADSTVAGPVGPSTGVPMTYSTTTTDADPGNGVVRANNTTPASVTFLYIDLLSATGFDITAWVDSFDDSTATLKGEIHLIDGANQANYIIYRITGAVTSATGYRKVPVTRVSGLTTNFANSTNLVLAFFKYGNDGADGAGAGTITGGTQLGSGEHVYKQTSGANLEFRSIKIVGAGWSINSSTTEITFTLGDALASLGGLTPSGNQVPYFTGASTAAMFSISADGRALVGAASYADMKTNMGLAAVASSGAYGDLSGLPTLGTAAALDVEDLATQTDINDAVALIDAKENLGEITGINTQTGATYTLVLADKGKLIRYNRTTGTMGLTVPPNSTVAFPINTMITVRRVGSGALTISQGSGVTINFPGGGTSKVITTQHTSATLVKVGTNEWDIDGGLS